MMSLRTGWALEQTLLFPLLAARNKAGKTKSCRFGNRLGISRSYEDTAKPEY